MLYARFLSWKLAFSCEIHDISHKTQASNRNQKLICNRRLIPDNRCFNFRVNRKLKYSFAITNVSQSESRKSSSEIKNANNHLRSFTEKYRTRLRQFLSQWETTNIIFEIKNADHYFKENKSTFVVVVCSDKQVVKVYCYQ